MNLWFANLTGISESWAVAMWRASWQGGAALAFTWLLCRSLPRISPRLQSALWRVAYLKLLVSLFWVGPIDIPLLPPPATQSPIVSGDSGISHTTSINEPQNEPTAKVLLTPGESRILPSPSAALLLLWLLLLSIQVVGIVNDWKIAQQLRLHCSSVTDSSLNDCCADLCKQMGLRGTPAIMKSDRISIPLVMGVLRPVIVLPSSILGLRNVTQLRMAFAHELAHIKRHDLIWAWLPAIARVLFPFHPLVWLSKSDWSLVSEMACDELAVEGTGAKVTEYANMLLAIATGAQQEFAPKLLAVGVCESYRTLKRRLVVMKGFKTCSSRRFTMFTAGSLSLALVVLVPWRIVAQQSSTWTREFQLQGPTGNITSVAFSPDGKTLATGATYYSVVENAGQEEHLIKLWDAKTGAELASFSGHTKEIGVVAFAPDGTTLFSGGRDGLVIAWEVQGKSRRFTLPNNGRVFSIAFSADGKKMAVAGFTTVTLWDTATWHQQAVLQHDGSVSVTAVAFAPKGGMLATGSSRDSSTGLVTIWDVETGREKKAIRAHTSVVWALAFSPDMKMLASGSWDSSVAIWDTGSWKELHRFEPELDRVPESRPVFTVAFTRDGKQLATGGYGPVKLWNTNTWTKQFTLEGTRGRAFAFSPNGTVFATIGAGKVALDLAPIAELQLWRVVK